MKSNIVINRICGCSLCHVCLNRMTNFFSAYKRKMDSKPEMCNWNEIYRHISVRYYTGSSMPWAKPEFFPPGCTLNRKQTYLVLLGIFQAKSEDRFFATNNSLKKNCWNMPWNVFSTRKYGANWASWYIFVWKIIANLGSLEFVQMFVHYTGTKRCHRPVLTIWLILITVPDLVRLVGNVCLSQS